MASSRKSSCEAIHASVDTRGVALPDFNHCIGDWITGCHIKDLGIKDQLDTLLIFNDVFRDVFARDIYIRSVPVVHHVGKIETYSKDLG
jgi:hypothetical protein